MSFDSCACCGRRDGLTSGGCLYCGMRTYCASCGQLLACGCGHASGAHACPAVTFHGIVEAVPIMPPLETQR